jgi:prepilin-type N-terminal cleavage/methylation domain-containing protein/prepilin-type processing-associated H-X9-DG protein
MGRVVSTLSRKAFTLLELLIVIAIIVILLGLLMPALNRTRRSATYVICASNLAQYARAGLMYLEDNDKVFPNEPNEWLYSKRSISKEHPIGCRWHDRAMAPYGEIMRASEEYRGKMWGYLKDVGIHPCPIFRDIARTRGCENPQHNDELDIEPQYSYTMNGYLGSKEDGGVLNESDVRHPGEVFFFAEENSWSIRPDHPDFPARWLQAPLSTKALDDTILIITPTPDARDCFATYHGVSSGKLDQGSSNVAFLDGHVVKIKVEDQLRKKMHGGNSQLGPAGNLSCAWAGKTEPPSGWDGQ